MLVVVTTGDLVHVNARTLEPHCHINLQGIVISNSQCSSVHTNIIVIVYYSLKNLHFLCRINCRAFELFLDSLGMTVIIFQL